MAAFPSTLPRPQASSYSGQQDAAFIRTEMEAGSQRQRQRFTAANHTVQMAWQFTAAQMADFKTFYDTTVNRGTDWFTMTVDVGGGDATRDCRFTAPYEYTYMDGGWWQVSAPVEIRGA
jgi:hypothetical protein